MSVARAGETITLTGDCPVEDAERLQRELLAAPDAPVDWSGCVRLHCAVLQVLLAARADVRGSPDDLFLRTHVQALLAVRHGT